MAFSLRSLFGKATGTPNTMTPQDASALLGQKDVLVVDVREVGEVQESGMIRGAINVPLSQVLTCADPAHPAHLPEFTPDKTVLVYCESGARSNMAARALASLGYTKVFNLGSFRAWKDNGGPWV
jgi:rhodanese-related sulfurtransferase